MDKTYSSFLSIIIPVYNKEKYIRDCINSILAQTFTNFEIIIINDGSTDNTIKILKSFKDSRIKLINTNNNGVSTARNIGINHASGQYIIFVDGDDTITPDYCERIVDDIIKYGCPDLLIFGLTKIYPSGNTKIINPYTDGIIKISEFQHSFMTETSEKEGIYGYICNKAIKRKIVNEYDIKFNPEIKLAEDFDFWLSVYSAISSIAMSSYSGYNYIQEIEGSSIFLANNYNQLIDIWLKCYKFLSPCNDSNNILLHHRIWGLCEAQLLELQGNDYITVKKNMQYISFVFSNIEKSDKYTPKSLLQRLIKKDCVVLVYLYLNARKIYHKITSCVR